MIVFVKESNRMKFFNIKFKTIGDKEFCFLSIIDSTKRRKIEKIAKKLCYFLKSKRIQTIALSENLFNNIVLKESLNGINILDGSKIFICFLNDIIENVMQNTNNCTYNTEISILATKNFDLLNTIVEQLAEKTKRLNIITNNISSFNRVKDKLYQEFGIIIKVSNNKKQDLLNSSVIVNIDFNQELFDKYIIPHKCILINIIEKIKIKSKRFEGININNFTITMPKDLSIEGFNNEVAFETLIYNKTFLEAEKTIRKYEIRVDELVGEKGFITNYEFLKNSLDKNDFLM